MESCGFRCSIVREPEAPARVSQRGATRKRGFFRGLLFRTLACVSGSGAAGPGIAGSSLYSMRTHGGGSIDFRENERPMAANPSRALLRRLSAAALVAAAAG